MAMLAEKLGPTEGTDGARAGTQTTKRKAKVGPGPPLAPIGCPLQHSPRHAGLLLGGRAISFLFSPTPPSSACALGWQQHTLLHSHSTPSSADGLPGLRRHTSWGLVYTYEKQPLIWRLAAHAQVSVLLASSTVPWI